MLSKMRILLVSQYFYPESFIINDLVKCLTAQGHIVVVLTGKPNYPDGVVFEGYRATGLEEERLEDGVVVHRVPIISRGTGSFRRLLNYLSFIVSGLLYFHRVTKGNEFDVILSFVPSPITSVIPAIYLKKRFKAHLAVWVQDLWPETLSATGIVKNQRALRMVGRLVRWIYACTDTLLVQSEAFFKPMSYYAPREKMVYYPNSYPEVMADSSLNNKIPSDLLFELENYFCLVFAGNLGSAQSLETLVEAAEYLKHLKDCKLILVGSGSMTHWIEQQLLEKGLDNIVLAGRFPPDMMPAIFSLSKGLLVTLKRDEIFTYTIPCKIQAYLASGRPIIAGLDGEGARVVQEAGAGFSSPAEDAVALAKNIEKLYGMPLVDRELLGDAGRLYFLDHFEMGRQSQRLIEIFESRIGKHG